MLFQVLNDPTQYLSVKELILAVFAVAEVVVRLTPTEKDNSILNKMWQID